MSHIGAGGRSFAGIGLPDLERLRAIAAQDRAEFFAANRSWGRLYAHRYLCTALCQGAALHYARGEAGVNDFDVFTFYAAHPRKPWCYRRRATSDFGDAKFGQSPDRPDFTGRRVDLLGRDLPCVPEDDPVEVVRRYLAEGPSDTARFLAAKAVVLLDPPHAGRLIWLQGRSVDE